MIINERLPHVGVAAVRWDITQSGHCGSSITTRDIEQGARSCKHGDFSTSISFDKKWQPHLGPVAVTGWAAWLLSIFCMNLQACCEMCWCEVTWTGLGLMRGQAGEGPRSSFKGMFTWAPLGRPFVIRSLIVDIASTVVILRYNECCGMGEEVCIVSHNWTQMNESERWLLRLWNCIATHICQTYYHIW